MKQVKNGLYFDFLSPENETLNWEDGVIDKVRNKKLLFWKAK